LFEIPEGLIEHNTLRQTSGRNESTEIDPRVRRFGYAPGVHLMEIEPRLSGRQEALIPQGTLIKFETTEIREENTDIDKPNWTQFYNREVPALEFLTNVKERFVKPGLIDVGFMELCRSRCSMTAAALHFHVLHPAFRRSRHQCPQGLKVCATCRLKWLTSDELMSRMTAAIETGRVSDSVLDETLEILVASNAAYLTHARQNWDSLVAEYDARASGADSKGIPSLKAGEHHLRGICTRKRPTSARLPSRPATAKPRRPRSLP
jgi:hypothetical protein